MVDFDEIRKEVAIKHGFVLDENDPVLVTVTLNKLMLRDYIEEMNEQQDAQDEKFKKKLVDALDLSVQRSQRIGENIAKSGAELIAKRANEAFTEALQKATNQIQRDLALAQKQEKSRFDMFLVGIAVGGVLTVVCTVLGRAASLWLGGL